MALVTPVQIYPGIQLDTNNSTIIIPLNVLPGLNIDEANPTAGDIRPVLLSIIEQCFRQLNALDRDSQPTDFTVTKSNPVGISTDKIRQNYSVSFAYSYDTRSTSFEQELSSASSGAGQAA